MVRRPQGGTSSASRKANFDVNITYDLFSVDEKLNERTPGNVTVNNITNYTFADAIENFKGDFDPSNAFPALFAFAPVSPGSLDPLDPAKVDVPTIPFLDLTARYLPASTLLTLADGKTPIIDKSDTPVVGAGQKILNNDRIEYIFSGSELEDKKISEVALVIENPDTLKDVQGNLILDTEEERNCLVV